MVLPKISNPLVNIIAPLIPNLTPFALDGLSTDGFPVSDFQKQTEMYNLLEEWYEGEPLNVVIVDEKTGKTVDKYPIKINPIKGTCKKHAARVIGQNVDSIRFGGLPFQLLPEMDKGKKKIGETIRKALLRVLTYNGFGAQFLSTTIRGQYLGGNVLMAKWIPESKQIEVSTPSPKEFVGIADGSNYNRLREAWIVREISLSDAEALGYKRNILEDRYFYIEHWTKDKYKIQVNNQTLQLGGQMQEGDNPFKLVPFVYVPHIRVNNFLGDSLITETIKGVIRELNLRWADIGDAVSDDSHDYVAVRNVQGGISTINVGDNRPVLDLGSASGIGGTSDPDMFAVGTKSASEPMLKFSQDLYQIYRREANHPAVADGEDEGSQRSSLTLNVRMAPLVDEAEFERLFWTIGLTEFTKVLLTIMSVKKQNGITEEMIDTPFTVQWQPMLPKDREALSTEVAVRAKNKVTSRKALNAMYGDIQDVDEDMEQIKEETELDQTQSPFGQSKPQPKQPEGINGSQGNIQR
jgi:hypothetical protein